MPLSRTRMATLLAVLPDAQLDAPAARGVLGGVAEHVADGLRQAQCVAVHGKRRVGTLNRQRVAAILDQRLDGLDGAGDERCDLDRLARQGDLAAGDT